MFKFERKKMVKDYKILIDACDLFLKENKVVIDYSSSMMKTIGRNKIILLNDVRIKKKELGSLVFAYVEQRIPFKKKWSMLCSDLANQILKSV